MVEVFKTNVQNWEEARAVLTRLRKQFSGYKVNFDLDDCDKILRVDSTTNEIEVEMVIELVSELGFEAEVLPDDLPLAESVMTVFGSYPFPYGLIN
jgi:hypothetical protein